jgi:hypothetical protein
MLNEIMKKPVLYILLLFCSCNQELTIGQIEKLNPDSAALEPLKFLSSDALMGRAITRHEIDMAAGYIAKQFNNFGLNQFQSTENYFQSFYVNAVIPADSGTFSAGGHLFTFSIDVMMVRGTSVNITAPIFFTTWDSVMSSSRKDVQGKIVLFDAVENNFAEKGLEYMDEAQKFLQQLGAVALVGRFFNSFEVWQSTKLKLLRMRSVQASDHLMPVLYVHDRTNELKRESVHKTIATIKSSGNKLKAIYARNVIGWIKGTDSVLSKQFIVLSAHYDHEGIAKKPVLENGRWDSIYNGARDNAIGIAALMNAARYFSYYPPKRSMLFMAYTGEEIGMVGSRYFAAHPVIPLHKIVYNLNTDNAGCNDSSLVTVVGMDRTTASLEIRAACAAYGLTAKPAPYYGQDLFEESDNSSLATKGIPALTFSMGIREFDQSIFEHYHQLSDEFESMDLKYAMKFIKSFILTAKLIADKPSQPKWHRGDKYEAAWNKLYLHSLSERN